MSNNSSSSNSGSEESLLASSYTVVVVGLNPALQKRLILSSVTPTLVPGMVHRASEVQEGIGGKGQDVAISLSCLSPQTKIKETTTTSPTTTMKNKNSPVQLVQFVGAGAEGSSILSMLSDKFSTTTSTNSNLSLKTTLRSQSKLRTCTTIVASDDATELVEPSGVILDDEVELLSQLLQDWLGETVVMDGTNENVATAADTTTATTTRRQCVSGLIIMGSMPPGCPKDLYAKFYSHVMKRSNTDYDTKEAICLIDSVVGLDLLINEITQLRSESNKVHQKRSTNVLKINLDELCKISNYDVTTLHVGKESDEEDSPQVMGARLSGLLSAFFDSFRHSRDALDFIAITDGKRPAYLVNLHSSTCTSSMTTSEREDNADEIELFIFDIPNLKDKDTIQNVLYPIGAGDAVAAGTTAAWQYLSHTKKNFERNHQHVDIMNSWLDQQVMDALFTTMKKEIVQEPINELPSPSSSCIMATAFAFGIACGSASCLSEENSVFDMNNVLRLFQFINQFRMKLVLSH